MNNKLTSLKFFLNYFVNAKFLKIVFLFFLFSNNQLFSNVLFNSNYSNSDIKLDSLNKSNNFKSFELLIGKEYLFSESNFTQIREISNCCDVNFNNNIGRALSLGIGTKFKIFEIENFTPINLIIGLNYSNNLMTFRRFQPILLGLDKELINGEFEHKVEFEFDFYSIKLAGEINIYELIDYRLGVDIGKASIFNFSQIEQITKPYDSGVFVNTSGNPQNDNKRTRNEISKVFENKNLFLAFDNNLIFKLPMNFDKISTFFNIGYKIIFNTILDNVDWKMNKLNTSIILNYKL